MKVVASVLQYVVLFTFARTEREPHQAAADLMEIRNRKKGEQLQMANRDGVSEHLFTYQELLYFMNASPGWFETMRDLLLSWTEAAEKVCRSFEKRNRK